MPGSSLQILVIGLDPFRVPGPWNPQPVVHRLAPQAAIAFNSTPDGLVEPVVRCLRSDPAGD